MNRIDKKGEIIFICLWMKLQTETWTDGLKQQVIFYKKYRNIVKSNMYDKRTLEKPKKDDQLRLNE